MQSVEIDSSYLEFYEEEKDLYKDQFIDLIRPVQLPDGKVPVFTPDGRFISQDCRHLTQAGAQYYAQLLDLD